MATKITQDPKHKVSNHTAPARDGYGLKSTWKYPKDATKDSKYRATNTFVSWDLLYAQGKARNIKLTRSYKTGDVSTTSSSTSINSFTTTSASRKADRGKKFTRESFWPYTTRRLTRVDHNVYLDNGCKGHGPVSTTTLNLAVPAAPSIGAFSFDTDTGTVKVKITAAKSTPKAERKLTTYTWMVERGKYNTTTKKFSVKETKVMKTGQTFSGGEKSLSYDCTDYQALADGELYLITVVARSQGLAGDSKEVTRRYVVAPPAAVTIRTKEITVTTGGSGRVTVPISVRRKYTTKKSGSKTVNDLCVNPVDGVVLQAAVNVEAKSASSVLGSDWDDVGSVDDGECVALTANTADLTPAQNNYTYVRVKSWRFDADCAPMCRYSNVAALSALRTVDSATDDECAILELTPTADGEGANVLIGYDKKDGSTRDDADGTEISWADASTAWNSTKRPRTFEVTWHTSTANAEEGSAAYPYKDIWHYVQRVYVEDLEEGVQYWFRARRYNDDSSGNRTYGKYCTKIWGTETDPDNVKTTATLTPTVRPTQVTLTAPPSAPTGSDLTLSWTYDGGDQTAYRVFLGGGNKVVAQASAASSSCVLKSSDYGPYVTEDGTLQVRVAVSTSKRRDVFTESGWATVTFAEPPVLEASVPTVTAQPATVYLYSSTAAAAASVTVAAMGSAGVEEVGIEPQVEGDDVWGGLATPDWSEITWAGTAWYAANVAPAVAASDAAWDTLPIATETFVGGTTATLRDVPVGGNDEEEVSSQELRPYVVVQPSGTPGAYMLATLDVDGSQWELASEPVWCDASGDDSEGGTYLRFPWPLSLYDDPETPTDEQAEAFDGCSVTLAYMPQGEEYDAAWDAYAELRAASDALVAAHDPAETVYEAAVEIPVGTDFRDGASYVLTATVTSATSGLASNVAQAEFAVAWAHQAPGPGDEITVTPYDVTDEDGNRTIGATIQLAEPEGAVDTDMADVWRVAADGWHLIAEGRGLTDAVEDSYAPFGDADLAYRVVVRTADGDVDWADFPYELDLDHTRIDFGGSYVELPYNIAVSHGYSKDSEQRQHLGEALPRGYWGSSHGRSFSVSSDLVRSASREQRRLLHELGRYMGPVLVRTPDGCCMEAEVTPDTSVSHDSSAVPASVRGTEIELTAEHMAVPTDEGGEES